MGDALAKAREIAARLSGGINASLGKRNRWDDDSGGGGGPGLGAIQRKKVYIPQKQHPDINFLGLLIGPKGATQKQMQEMSGAKIIMRGRGASKDGSGTGHADDDDELHVCIEGTADAVEKALKEVEQILFNPEQASRLKSVQLQHLHNMNNGGGGGGDIYGPSGSGSEYQIELRVPNNMVGLIIGKGGENILRIQSQLGVHAQIAKENEMQPGETLRSIVLKGSPSGVAEAKTRIDDIITAQLMKMNGGSSGGGGGGNIKDRELDNAFVVKLPVPNDKVGIIIGKGGMTIKGIQERTRAQVQIPANPDENDPGVRTLSIGGDTKESVDAAQMEIFMALQSQQQQAQQAYNSTANAMGLMVPDDKVGIIIGKGGATIKDIQNRLKVRVQIPQAPDIGSNPPMRTISIVGAADMQSVAKYEIEMIVSGTPLHNGQGGGGGQYGQNNYGQQQSNPWDPQAAVFGSQQQSYYGAQASAYGAQSAYGMAQQYGYGAYQAGAEQVNPYIAQAQAQQAALLLQQQQAAQQPAGEVPTDPTAYYNDFWQYSMYYGEAAARVYYGAWSPPEGTPPPPGIVVAVPAPPTDPLVPILPVDTNNAGPPPADDSQPAKKERREESATTATTETAAADAPEDPEAAAAAWELYKKQYSEWYEAYGKATGADPNPPSM